MITETVIKLYINYILYAAQTQCILILNAHFVAEETYCILPRSPNKNQLHEALTNGRYEDASQLIKSQSEAHLLECFEGIGGCFKSNLHLIAGRTDKEEATKLCQQLMQKINNTVNSEYLLNTRTIDECNMGGWKVHALVAAIHIAAYSGNSGVVRILCHEYGVDVNCRTSKTLEEKCKEGMTPLEWAARKGHKDVVQVLLENKAEVNASRHKDGATSLYVAAQSGHAEVVKLLLDRNADVNASRHTDGATSLHVAAQSGHAEVVKLLLDRNADVNASRHTDGATSLYAAA